MPEIFSPTSEINNQRTYNSKSFFTSDGQIAREFRVKWIHYFDNNNTWQEIDSKFVDLGTHFEITKAPFIARVPKTSAGIAEFVSNNRWDVFEKRIIPDGPFTQTIKALNVADVPGQIEMGDLGFGNTQYVVYPGAYPTINADLIYWVHHGRAPRLRKLVRFNSNPGVVADLRLEFELTYSSEIEIKSQKEILSQAEIALVETHLKKARDIEALKQKSKFRDMMLAELDALDVKRQVWNKVEKLITKRGISHRPIGAIGRRGIGLKDFLIWDSDKKRQSLEGKQPLEVEYEKIGSIYKLTKIIPKSFLDTALYPVYTDTTSTFFPDPNVETTSVDGWVETDRANETWTAMIDHTGTGANDIDASATQAVFTVGGATSPNWNRIRFSVTIFDTSSIPDTDTIDSATHSGYCPSTDDVPDYGVAMVSFRPATASSTALASADYQASKQGTLTSATTIDIGSVTVNAYNDFTLNAAGLTGISKTGVTKLGFTTDKHQGGADTPPTWQSGEGFNAAGMSYAETADTTQDPKLVVVHSAAASNHWLLMGV